MLIRHVRDEQNVHECLRLLQVTNGCNLSDGCNRSNGRLNTHADLRNIQHFVTLQTLAASSVGSYQSQSRIGNSAEAVPEASNGAWQSLLRRRHLGRAQMDLLAVPALVSICIDSN